MSLDVAIAVRYIVMGTSLFIRQSVSRNVSWATDGGANRSKMRANAISDSNSQTKMYLFMYQNQTDSYKTRDAISDQCVVCAHFRHDFVTMRVLYAIFATLKSIDIVTYGIAFLPSYK